MRKHLIIALTCFVNVVLSQETLYIPNSDFLFMEANASLTIKELTLIPEENLTLTHSVIYSDTVPTIPTNFKTASPYYRVNQQPIEFSGIIEMKYDKGLLENENLDSLRIYRLQEKSWTDSNPNTIEDSNRQIKVHVDSEIINSIVLGFTNMETNTPTTNTNTSTTETNNATEESNSNSDDSDEDGWSNSVEIACGSNPLDYYSRPLDSDGDGLANCVDMDIDNDGCANGSDAFPMDRLECYDFDEDGIGDNADLDDDNDGQIDTDEMACGSDPFDASSTASDWDLDGILDCLDEDDDNDGVADTEDSFPYDPNEWADNDLDGIGDNADLDDDNDGWEDLIELHCQTDPFDSSSQPNDVNQNGIADCEESFVEENGDQNNENQNSNGSDTSNNSNNSDNSNNSNDSDNSEESEGTEESNENSIDTSEENSNHQNNGIDELSETTPIIVSNLITPYSGTRESRWIILNIEKYPKSRIRIYNKNAVEVYTSLNYKNDWNGVYKNSYRPLPAGSYFYEINLNNGERPVVGWIYITY